MSSNNIDIYMYRQGLQIITAVNDILPRSQVCIESGKVQTEILQEKT